MAKIIIPTANETLITLLSTALQVTTGDKVAGVDYVEADWGTEVEPFLAGWRVKVRSLTQAQQRRAQEIAERRAAVDKLEIYVRDFMVGLKRRVEREELPADYYNFFKLPLDGALPTLSTINDVLTQAELLVEGDAAAVSAGYEALCNPTAAQMASLLSQAQAESADIPAVERELDTVQDEVEALRSQAVELSRDLADQLNFRLRKLEAPDRRRIIRRYGFSYRYAEGEPQEDIL